MKVVAGDWPENANVAFQKSATGRATALMFQRKMFSFDTYTFDKVKEFVVVTEENRASIGGKLGWGVLGAVALGPLGLVAGAVLGGNKRERVFSVVFSDGKKALIKGNSKDAEILTAASFR